MNKLLKIGAFAVGAAILAPRVIPQLDPKIAAAAGGFFAGGPMGAVAGYIGAPIIQNTLGGTSTMNKTYGSYY